MPSVRQRSEGGPVITSDLQPNWPETVHYQSNVSPRFSDIRKEGNINIKNTPITQSGLLMSDYSHSTGTLETPDTVRPSFGPCRKRPTARYGPSGDPRSALKPCSQSQGCPHTSCRHSRESRSALTPPRQVVSRVSTYPVQALSTLSARCQTTMPGHVESIHSPPAGPLESLGPL